MVSDPEKHVRIVCFILKIIGFLYLIGSVAFLALGTNAFFNKTSPGDIEVIPASLAGLMVLTPLVLFGVLHILAARGFVENEGWARILLWIFSLINLTNLPFGTAFGAYSIWVLYQSREA